MRKYKIIYILIWAVVLLCVLFQEIDLLPQAFLPQSPVAVYVADLISVATAVIGIYFACRLFSFKKVKEELNSEDRETALAAQKRWNGRRLLILAVAVFPSAFLYYAMSFRETSLYCMLIALTGSLFCWPYSDNSK